MVMEVVPSRALNLLYILLDIGFLLFLFGVLMVCRKYLAALFGLFGGLLYFWWTTADFICCSAPEKCTVPIRSGFCSG